MHIDEKYLSGCDEYLSLHMWQPDSGLTYNAHFECTYGTKYRNIYLDDILIPKFQNLYNHARDYLLCSSTQSIESIQDWYQWDSIASVLWSYQECKASSFENDRLKPFYSQQIDINRGYSLVSSMRKSLDLIMQHQNIDQLKVIGNLINYMDKKDKYGKYKKSLSFLYLANQLANSNKHSLALQQYNPWVGTEGIRVFSVEKYEINLDENINDNQELKFFSISEGHLENINSVLNSLAFQANTQGKRSFSLIVEFNIHINQLIISYIEFILLLLKEENYSFVIEKE